MRRRFLTVVLGLALAGRASPAPAHPQTYAGVWDYHFETSSFVTDDGRGPWWLSADAPLWEALNAPFDNAGGGPWGRLELVVEGELSPPGHYGHLGAYTHELRITRVIEARLMTAAP